MSRLFPHPGLSGLLVVVWLLLQNEFSVATVLFALIVGLVVPIVTSPYWRNKPKIRFGWLMVDYLAVVVWDIFIANFQVAGLILFKRNRDMRSMWLVIPLDVRQPEAITTLACTISLTPGTVSADISFDGRSLLVHALDVADRDADIARMKSRYEARLIRIFQ